MFVKRGERVKKCDVFTASGMIQCVCLNQSTNIVSHSRSVARGRATCAIIVFPYQ